MAETSGGKKEVYVHPYVKEDGTKIPQHYRSTPKTACPPKPTPRRR